MRPYLAISSLSDQTVVSFYRIGHKSLFVIFLLLFCQLRQELFKVIRGVDQVWMYISGGAHLDHRSETQVGY